MQYFAVATDYAVWWYSGGIKRLYLWTGALFGWLNNFFSIKRILKTLFAPWKRLIGEKRPGLEGFRDFLIDNLVSRSVGFIVRLATILLYILSLIILSIFALLCFILWIGWPFILAVSFIGIFI